MKRIRSIIAVIVSFLAGCAATSKPDNYAEALSVPMSGDPKYIDLPQAEPIDDLMLWGEELTQQSNNADCFECSTN